MKSLRFVARSSASRAPGACRAGVPGGLHGEGRGSLHMSEVSAGGEVAVDTRRWGEQAPCMAECCKCTGVVQEDGLSCWVRAGAC